MAEPKPRQRRFAPRSRTGCLTCRTRRKRCDNAQPQCKNCIRLNLTCEWQALRKIVAEPPVQPHSTSPELQIAMPLPSSLDPWDALPGDGALEQKHLLQYYIEALVPSISVAHIPTTSFYTSLYVPWSFQIEGMLDAILAISSAQLARRTADEDREKHLRDLSSRHERKCYGFIKERLSPSGGLPRNTYQVTAVILILVGLEALNGVKTTRWLSQLKSVQRILNALSPEQSIIDCVEVDSLHRHFTYHFASASLMARVSNASVASSTEQALIPVSAAIMPGTIDPLMGISYHLCDLISRIQYVTASNPAFPLATEASFHVIESGIKSWAYEDPFALGVDTPIALDLIALAEAYRLAALIQLYRTSPMHAPLIPGCASRVMEFIARIPPGSPAEASLLYPVFLAGAELDDELAIERCFKRLECIQKRNWYENIGSAQKVLKEVWRPKLEGGERRDWEEVVREWNWSFTLG
ncbi:putative Zn(II)2Cys6 transcription factor-like protein [Decorospora gaudefroyi]|uniref:Putative Zn(II)2Cys6 transcription factor-like protein n=1 Tax=Decorospora gaudefroyi TaxID=184978 RepID=A0A6A5JYU7_9PLEO|nr:putative Zn(II)2Cys6 transcription factor-like protein [Decorospora gaudefroyi]